MKEFSEDDGKSMDIIADNLEKLKQIFPEAYKEGKIDFNTLEAVLSGHIDDKEEKFGLNWHGKKRARNLALIPSTATLRPCPDESIDWGKTKNIMIDGDNLEVLKLLQKSYSGKVKMIYIDPPYNTGKDFVYKDNFKDNLQNYLEYTGQTENGNRTTTNTESSGRYHTDWLNMMYPRLMLARNLLRQDGVIFISIDDNEVHNLRNICNEIFGEENFVAQLIWYYEGVNDNQYVFRKTHEYLIVYGKVKTMLKNNIVYDPNVNLNEIISNSVVKNGLANPPSPIKLPKGFPCELEKGVIKKENVESVSYDNDIVIENYKLQQEVSVTSGWSSKTILENYINNNFNEVDDFNKQKTHFIIKKSGNIFYTKKRETAYLISVLRNFGTTMNAAKQLNSLFNCVAGFSYPKPINLISFLISIYSNSNDIILDFFSGSATTAHAVMQLNAEDGGNRKFIMVQLPEKTAEDSEAYKAGYKTIADIGKERIRRTGKKIMDEMLSKKNDKRKGDTEQPSFFDEDDNSPTKDINSQLDIGFRVYKTDTTNIAEYTTYVCYPLVMCKAEHNMV